MGCNSKEYVATNRLYLNQRAKISYYNRTLKLDYKTTIHPYEAEHGLLETIIWMKRQLFNLKYGDIAKLKEKVDVVE